MNAEIKFTVPERNFRGELTLAGAFIKYFPEVSRNWNADRTINENIADFEKRIIGTNNPLKPLKDYTASELAAIVDVLSSRKEYEPATREHYLFLIRNLIRCCIEANEELHPTVMAEYGRNAVKRKGGIVKSFTPQEESAIVEWIESLTQDQLTGPVIAFVMMFYFGFRNQEAAGLMFSSLDYHTNHGVPMLRMMQTMIKKSRRTKRRGKTRNAHREIPCISKTVLKIVQMRKDYILSHSEVITEDDIALYPLCSAKKRFDLHCTTDEITEAAKRIFNSLGIVGNTWNEVLAENEWDSFAEIREDSETPQAYALRRNALTRFYGDPIRLDEAELQYIAGHEIEDPTIRRSDYTNADIMRPIIRKMSRCKLYDYSV